MDLITVWEPEPWYDQTIFQQVLRDALIFLARSRNEHLVAAVFDDLDQTILVTLGMQPDDRLGWIRPNLVTAISDDALETATLRYDEDDARHSLRTQQFNYVEHSRHWVEFELAAAISEAQDCAEGLMIVLGDIYEDMWAHRSVHFRLPTIYGQSAYRVRPPSEGHRYATDKQRYEQAEFLRKARELARSDLGD
jgi:hypothetical protein